MLGNTGAASPTCREPQGLPTVAVIRLVTLLPPSFMSIMYLVNARVKVQDLKNLLLSELLREVGTISTLVIISWVLGNSDARVTLLPEELSCPEKWGRLLRLPTDLMYQDIRLVCENRPS